MTLVDFAYFYEAEAILQGKRKPQVYTFESTMTIDVPEVEHTPELTAILMNTFQDDPFLKPKKIIVSEYRQFDDRLWTPFVVSAEDVPDSQNMKKSSYDLSDDINQLISEAFNDLKFLDKERLTTAYGFTKNDGLTVKQLKTYVTSYEKSYEAEENIKTLVSTTKDMVEKKLRTNIENNMMFFDNRLFMATNGPVYNAKTCLLSSEIQQNDFRNRHAYSEGWTNNAFKHPPYSENFRIQADCTMTSVPILTPLFMMPKPNKFPLGNLAESIPQRIATGITLDPTLVVKDLNFMNKIQDRQKGYYLFDYLTNTGLKYSLYANFSLDYKAVEKNYTSARIFKEIIERSSNATELKNAIQLCHETDYSIDSVLNMLNTMKGITYSTDINHVPRMNSHNKTRFSSDSSLMLEIIRHGDYIVRLMGAEMKYNLVSRSCGETLNFDNSLNHKNDFHPS